MIHEKFINMSPLGYQFASFVSAICFQHVKFTNIFESIKFNTMSVEFSFDNSMYRQTDGDLLWLIFLWSFMKRLRPSPNKLVVFIFVVLTIHFVFSIMGLGWTCFLHLLDTIFTVDKEDDYILPFLDILVHRTPLCYVTLIYHKPTFVLPSRLGL